MRGVRIGAIFAEQPVAAVDQLSDARRNRSAPFLLLDGVSQPLDHLGMQVAREDSDAFVTVLLYGGYFKRTQSLADPVLCRHQLQALRWVYPFLESDLDDPVNVIVVGFHLFNRVSDAGG